jgi:DNA-binding NtrC family response regulator
MARQLRDLRNRVDRAIAISIGEWIMPGDLFPEKAAGREGFAPLSDVRDAAERRQIERAIRETGGQVAKADDLLAISRTTLWEKMTRLRIGGRPPSSW